MEEFAQRMRDMHGERGAAWLAELPDMIAAYEQRWQIKVDPQQPFALSFNYVVPAQLADGTAAVFKMGLPSAESRSETAALRLCNGVGMVRLIEADDDNGALLLERLRPGEMLAAYFPERDEAATALAAEVMRAVWRPLPAAHPLPDLRRWTHGIARIREHFDGGTGMLPEPVVARAEQLRESLLASASSNEITLLHGDLHHYNILSAVLPSRAQQWLAIDPKGVAGERAYECAAFLRNPGDFRAHPNARSMLARRVDQLVDLLELDRERIVAWSFVQGVLSAWWCVEDNVAGWESSIAFAALMLEI